MLSTNLSFTYTPNLKRPISIIDPETTDEIKPILYFDEETKAELHAIADDDKEIKERFYRELEFGTAGLRGVIGMGTNRMNKYTVGKATQGLANYILEQGTQDKGVAISYDSRIMSKEFGEQTALILNANGIKTYLKITKAS